jgi:hypothetical protein
VQSHLDVVRQPPVEDAAVEAIRAHCDNHPYLVQLVCKRYLETGELEEAIDQVATDRMVSYFFSVDFEMLSEAERRVIQLIAGESGASRGSIREALWLSGDVLDDSLLRLENLGFIRSNGKGGVTLANYFFRRWLRDIRAHTESPPTEAAPAPSKGMEETAPRLAGQARADVPASGGTRHHSVRPAGGLVAELRRRSVFRIGLAYVAAAWVLLQVGDIVFNFLEVPRWAGKLLLAFLALGLPVALILAWVFELTPEGVKREKDVDRSKQGARGMGRRLDFLIIAILAVAVILLVLDKFI